MNRHQAESLPDVSRVETDYSHLQKRQTRYIHDSVLNMPSSPQEFLPNEKWELDMLHNFSELRMFIYRKSLQTDGTLRKIPVPALKDSQGWMLFCLGRDIFTTASSAINIFNNNPLSVNDSSFTKAIRDHTEDILQKRKLEVSRIAGIDITDASTSESMSKQSNIRIRDDDSDKAVDISIDNYDDKALPDTTRPPLISSSAVWTGAKMISPTLELLLQFDQVMTQRLLSHQIDWLVESKYVKLVLKAIPTMFVYP